MYPNASLKPNLLGLIYPRPQPLRPNLSHICAPSPILILWDHGKGMVLLKMISRLHCHKIISSIQELHWVMKVLRLVNSTIWMAYTKVEPKWKRTHFLFNQFHHRRLSDFIKFSIAMMTCHMVLLSSLLLVRVHRSRSFYTSYQIGCQ